MNHEFASNEEIMIQPPKDPRRPAKLDSFDRLLTMMDELRLNCPWDKKQTIESIRHLTIEEVYELSDAIIEQDLEEVKKEMGDIMLHLIFYARIASEIEAFDIADVMDQLIEKMVRRHPHVYGDVEVQDEETVKKNWEQIKLQEGKKDKRVLEGVPSSLPAMTKAVRIQSKARGVGFDWDNKDQVWEKVHEELEEFKAAKTPEHQEEEFGDLLFSLINYARFVDIDPEQALEKTNKKFIYRFNYLEEEAKKDGKALGKMSLEEMDAYWNAAKEKN